MAVTLNNFSFSTVMDVSFYAWTWSTTLSLWVAPTTTTADATSDSLRMSNITTEGPKKTAKGGLYAKTKMRYGKTMRLEMEDVIFTKDALEHLFGAGTVLTGGVSLTDKFTGPYKIVGTTFGVGPTGEKQWMTVTIHKFLPDALLNITMEAEGDFAAMAIGGEMQPVCGAFFTIGDDSNPCTPLN